MQGERRHRERTTLRHLSVIRTEKDDLLATEIVNISEGGIAFHSDKPVPDQGNIYLYCPGHHCRVEYELVHQYKDAGGFRAGARLRLAGSQTGSFERYLNYVRARQAVSA